MKETDIIVTWPRNCDYPVWRDFIRQYRHLFNKVIIVFMETNQGHDYRHFLRDAMAKDNITFLQSPKIQPGEDWRNVAVNLALEHSTSKWVWFTEQDFLIHDMRFLTVAVFGSMAEMDVIGMSAGGRLHPCCIFIKRETLEKTHKNFGIVPDRSDHFGQLQKDIEGQNMSRYYYAEDPVNGFVHFNGLSHNWTLLSNGETPNYKIEDFQGYLELSLDAEKYVELSPFWKRIALDFINRRNALNSKN